MSLYLSKNQKVGFTFDVPRKESGCQKHCFISSQCFMNDNLQDKINNAYKKKKKRNFRLLLSKKFISKVSKEIVGENILRVRIFSDGDIIYDDFEKSRIQLDNIFGLCHELPHNRFWLTSRNCNALMDYLATHEKPENLNIMLSIDGKQQSKPLLAWCEEKKIQVSYVTEKKKESNCPASKNHESCYKNNCFKCFDYDQAPRVWLLHGKRNIRRLETKRK